MILTRYLYSKEKLVRAFENCLCDKKDEAIYFAYELYFSGFEAEVWEILWRHYFLYCFVENADYELYLKQLEKSWKKKKDACMISQIIQDMFIRKYVDIKQSDLNRLSKDELLTYYHSTSNNIYNKIVLVKPFPRVIANLSNKDILIARVLALSTPPSTKKITFYIEVDLEDIYEYRTQQYAECKGWMLLRDVVKYNLDDYLSTNDGLNIKSKSLLRDDFVDNWIYYSSSSPLWAKRILLYGGIIDNINKKIVFDDEDNEELFYNMYHLEPDEQPMHVFVKLNYNKVLNNNNNNNNNNI